MKKAFAVAVLLFTLAPYAFGTCYLTYFTENIPDFTLNTPGSFTLDVCCGTTPYTFTITGGTLPAGLSMSSSGTISGTPTAVADNTVYFTVTDAVGCHVTQAMPVRVNP